MDSLTRASARARRLGSARAHCRRQRPTRHSRSAFKGVCPRPTSRRRAARLLLCLAARGVAAGATCPPFESRRPRLLRRRWGRQASARAQPPRRHRMRMAAARAAHSRPARAPRRCRRLSPLPSARRARATRRRARCAWRALHPPPLARVCGRRPTWQPRSRRTRASPPRSPQRPTWRGPTWARRRAARRRRASCAPFATRASSRWRLRSCAAATTRFVATASSTGRSSVRSARCATRRTRTCGCTRCSTAASTTFSSRKASTCSSAPRGSARRW
mmetsp:Transcript_10615/g.22556  ORF Transcript_10615/g.22556 Transcript_10615/m.22556 type:complete len:275 (+) Transcript_10615:714-1538(+)